MRKPWIVASATPLLLATACLLAPASREGRFAATVRARAWFESGQLRRAASTLDRLASDSRDTNAWTNLGFVQLHRGKTEAALRAWAAALAIDASSARAHYGIGLVRQAQADALARRAERGGRGNGERRTEAEEVLQAAAAEYEAAVRAEPTSAALHHALEIVYREQGRAADAERVQREVSRLDPSGTQVGIETAALAAVRLPPRPAGVAGQIPVRFTAESLAVRGVGLAVVPAAAGPQTGLVVFGTGSVLRGDSTAGRWTWTEDPLLASGRIVDALGTYVDADARLDVVLAAEPAAAAEPLPAPTPVAAARGARPARQAPATRRTEIWLWRGGAASAEPIGEVPYAVRALHAADVDRDGAIDVVAAAGTAPGVRVWRNTGGGRFDLETQTPELATIPALRALVCADLNGDARVDLAGADGAGRLRVLIQGESGAFRDASALAGLGFERARALEGVDLDADGALDLLVGNDAGLWVYANRGGARFIRAAAFRAPRTGYATEQPPSPAVAALVVLDFDNDGLPDVVTYHPSAALPGPVVVAAAPGRSGSGRVSASQPASTPAAAEDTAPEPPIPYGPQPARLRLWRNDGRGVLLDVTGACDLRDDGGLAAPSVAADLDGDGDTDLAGLRADSTVVVHWNHGGNARRRVLVTLTDARGPQGGVGAWLEVHAGQSVQCTFVRAQPVWVGAGEADRFDAVRVVWPDGHIENHLDVAIAADSRLRLARLTTP